MSIIFYLRGSIIFIVFLIFSLLFSMTVDASYVEILSPESFVGGNVLLVEGAVESFEGGSGLRWFLELGKKNGEDFVLIRELNRGTGRVGNSDNEDGNDDYGVLYRGDASKLNLVDREEYALRLRAEDSVSNDQTEATFIKVPRSFNIKLTNTASSRKFYVVDAYLRGAHQEEDIEWADFSVEFEDENAVCKAVCLIKVDDLAESTDLYFEKGVRVTVVATDNLGDVYIFHKIYPDTGLLTLSTGDAKLIKTNFQDIFTEQDIPVKDISVGIEIPVISDNIGGEEKLFETVSYKLLSEGLPPLRDLQIYGQESFVDPAVYGRNPFITLTYFGINPGQKKIMSLYGILSSPSGQNLIISGGSLMSRKISIADSILYDNLFMYFDEYFVKGDQEIEGSIWHTPVFPGTYTFLFQSMIGEFAPEEYILLEREMETQSLYSDIFDLATQDQTYLSTPFVLEIVPEGELLGGRLKDANGNIYDGKTPGDYLEIKKELNGEVVFRSSGIGWFFKCQGWCKVGDVFIADWKLSNFLKEGDLSSQQTFTFAGNRFIPGIVDPFLRGNSNNDGKVDLSDAIFLLDYLFKAGKRPECLDAADVNDDGVVDIADPIRLLFVLFQGGQMPAPYPQYGTDPTEDDFECWIYER